MDPPSEVVYRLAEDLHRRFRQPQHNWSLAQVPVIVEPAEVLHHLRRSLLASLLVSEGAVLNDLSSDWYDVKPVRARDDDLTSAGVTVSVWPWADGRAAELIVRLLYGRTERASQEISLHVAASRPPTLVHYVYDHQRAETGYEGDQRVTSQASPEELHEMVMLVRRIVPAVGQPIPGEAPSSPSPG